MSKETSRNHYIRQSYMKQFSDNFENIFYRDKNIKEPKKLNSPKSICFVNNLYTLQEKITNEDLDYFYALTNLNNSKKNTLSKQTCRLIMNYLNGETISFSDINIENYMNSGDRKKDMLEKLFKFYEDRFDNIYKKLSKSLSLPQVDLSNHNIDDLIINFYIHFYCVKVNHYYKNLINDNDKEKTNLIVQKKTIISSLKSKRKNNDYIELMFYMVLQIFRTKFFVEKLSKIYGGKSFGKKQAYLFVSYMPFVFLSFLIQENYKLTLLNNKTKIKFITSDNPCINIETLPKCKLFFPLSNNLAIICTNEKKYYNSIDITKEEDIILYNNMQKNMSERYWIGSSIDLLNKN